MYILMPQLCQSKCKQKILFNVFPLCLIFFYSIYQILRKYLVYDFIKLNTLVIDQRQSVNILLETNYFIIDVGKMLTIFYRISLKLSTFEIVLNLDESYQVSDVMSSRQNMILETRCWGPMMNF